MGAARLSWTNEVGTWADGEVGSEEEVRLATMARLFENALSSRAPALVGLRSAAVTFPRPLVGPGCSAATGIPDLPVES